jgi:hypothetical protein
LADPISRLDFFLWGLPKDRTFKMLCTVGDLRRNITNEIAAVPPANVDSNIRDNGASCRRVPPDGMKEILASSASQLYPQLVKYVLAKCIGKLFRYL